jgi:putative redox protein
MHFLTPAQQQLLKQDGQVNFSSRGRRLMLNREFFDDAERYNLTAATQSLTIPMLVVHGDQDEIIPVSEAHLAKSTNPAMVELVVVPGGNHMLSRPEDQQQVANTVAEWFRLQAGSLSAT